MIIFFLFGLSIAFFLFLLLVIKRNKKGSDRVLAAWLGFMTLHIGLFLLDYYKITYDYPHLLGVIFPLPVLHGLFLYWYTSQTTGKKISTGSFMTQLLPFILLVTLAVPFYMLPGAEKVRIFLNKGEGFEWYSTIKMGLFVVFGLGSSIASIVAIRKYRKRLLNVVSNTEKNKLTWLECIAYGFAVIWLMVYPASDSMIFTGVALLVLFIGVFGINRTPVFLPEMPAVTTMPIIPAAKYQKTGLTEDTADNLSAKLNAFMEINKPYTNPGLTLDELAAKLNFSSNQVSQVINAQLGKTFYHYVNGYRIKEFLTLSAKPESRKFTYMGLAYECGFQSKTTFNKYFKLETGRTPSEYFTSSHPYSSQALSPTS